MIVVCVFCCFCSIIVYVDVTLDLNASNDGASAVLAGRLFHSLAVLGKNECACASISAQLQCRWGAGGPFWFQYITLSSIMFSRLRFKPWPHQKPNGRRLFGCSLN